MDGDDTQEKPPSYPAQELAAPARSENTVFLLNGGENRTLTDIPLLCGHW
jgi:hypothetical protein